MVSLKLKSDRVRVGRTITIYRRLFGLSSKALAHLVDIDPANLSRIERGKYSVGLDILNRIADALDCKVVIVPNCCHE